MTRSSSRNLNILKSGCAMSYYFSKQLNCNFEDAIARTTEQLKVEGFGVLTEIDIKATLKKKLDVDFPKYQILGACSPALAYKALQAEDHIGTMLPCNVIVREMPDGKIEVSAVDPVESMKAITNPKLGDVAAEVRQKLQSVIEKL